MSTEGKRKELIRKIQDTIVKASNENKTIDRSKLEASICIDEGVTKSKAKEYIDLLIEAVKIRDDDGILSVVSSE